jgi:hypothetical protein
MATQPVSRKFADVKAWAALAGVLLVALGAAVLALLAQSTGNNAIDCVNNTLGARSDLTVQSAQAQATFAAADKAYNVADGKYNAAVNDIISHAGQNNPGGQPVTLRAQLAAASTAKRHAAQVKQVASDQYQESMRAIIKVALAHPLGRC